MVTDAGNSREIFNEEPCGGAFLQLLLHLDNGKDITRRLFKILEVIACRRQMPYFTKLV